MIDQAFIDSACSAIRRRDVPALSSLDQKVTAVFSQLSEASSVDRLDGFIRMLLCITESKQARQAGWNGEVGTLICHWEQLVDKAAGIRDKVERAIAIEETLKAAHVQECLRELEKAEALGISIYNLAARLSITVDETDHLISRLESHDLAERVSFELRGAAMIRLGLHGQMLARTETAPPEKQG
ncbi:MAG: hypothetical protein A2751_01490 [Candidatus Doudnabacteria bacterium RIFCSPHIGHO2_01_FULL_46_14]|uniref:Uncharacterized protein n=1 Tax=Candidatus Doudnabacteria bacterium RIFCSPHIGHO2_01_FULL_46_14 TaxID=1817824 RepID=A0A1F5NP60_9BACT|nr:MAG: hypothetical protein A2751_01490 [Candidatus Doudnabacteria bacterium RIFCSPHIGHO2_01_FULL_46_14]